MASRRGFTLIELLIVVVVLAIVGTAATRVFVSSMRVSGGQAIQADMQSNVRTAGLVLPLELREIGYDSNITTTVVTSDIEVMTPTEIQFRAMRGFGSTCGTPSLTQWWIRRPLNGFRNPQLTDGFLLYVESDPNTGIDDQWLQMNVQNIDLNATCNGDPAIRLDLASVPQMAPGVNLALSQIFIGGPIRFYERMRFGSFVDADGLTYVGARSVSLGENAYRAVAGPIAPGNGVQFLYYGRGLGVLDPAVATPDQVRTVQITLVGRTRNPVNLAGAVDRRTAGMTTVTRISLRNTLSH